MLSAINNQHQPAFQAKLNIKKFKIPNSNEICEKFENLTRRYANDSLDLTASQISRCDGTFFKDVDFVVNGRDVGFIATLREFKMFCKKHTPDEIAKSLSKIFKVGKFGESSNKKRDLIFENLNSARLTLFRAQNRPDNNVSRVLVNSSQARVNTLEKQLKANREKRNEVIDKILGKDPINDISYADN